MIKMLRILHPPGYAEERKYIFQIIFEEFLGLSYECQEGSGDTVQIRLAHGPEESVLVWPDVLFQTSPERWLTEVSLPQAPLPMWNAGADLPDAALTNGFLPVIYGRPLKEGRWFEKKDKVIQLGLDVAGSVFFILTRYEEVVLPVRDKHGRFPATASVAYKEGFLDRPIVDEYALILGACLKTLLPDWEPRLPHFSVKLSHDIDSVWSGNGVLSRGRTIAGDFLKRRDPKKALLTAGSIFQPQSDPMFASIFDLAKYSEECGLRGAFYFMGARKGQYEQGYDPASPLVRQALKELHDRGHEIGFHPGYSTVEDSCLWREELARLRAAAGDIPIRGGRQHYLRFQVPATWRLWEEAGLQYDSTLTYADHEGFRCGTCHPFRPYDIERKRVMDVMEIPLIVMDVTLKQYRSLSPEQAEERILTLAERCRQVGGTFTLLWHNSSLIGEWASWVPMYQRVLRRLSEWV